MATPSQPLQPELRWQVDGRVKTAGGTNRGYGLHPLALSSVVVCGREGLTRQRIRGPRAGRRCRLAGLMRQAIRGLGQIVRAGKEGRDAAEMTNLNRSPTTICCGCVKLATQDAANEKLVIFGLTRQPFGPFLTR